MLQKLKFTDIITNDKKALSVEGTIKKICIRTKQDLFNVKLFIDTSDNEVLYNGFVNTGQNVYPKNIQIINNVVCKEDVVLMGGVRIIVTGLEPEQRIDEISFIIDTDRDKLRDTF